MSTLSKNCLLLALGLMVTGCSWFHLYRPNIQQGNVYSQAMIDRLKPGMSQDQVRYLMGTPVLQSSLEPNRWDYIYSYQKGGNPRHQKDVTLYFDQKGLLQRFEQTPLATVKE